MGHPAHFATRAGLSESASPTASSNFANRLARRSDLEAAGLEPESEPASLADGAHRAGAEPALDVAQEPNRDTAPRAAPSRQRAQPAPLWGLAVGGADGVQRVVELLREETELALALCGCASPSEVTRSGRPRLDAP